MLPTAANQEKRVAIYARVSSEDQAERGTIENQIEFARKYCDLHELDVVEWYRDDGVTGTIPLEMRDAGRRLLEDAKAGRFELLLVYRLDRLGRSARIILNAVYDLEQYGVKIRSMTEPFDTGDPNGRFLLTVLAGVADLERETILERMWHGANRAARAGKWLGGIIPYGYRVNEEGFLEINEDPLPGMDMNEADVVRLIYHLIAGQGYSTIKVADYLNALGVPPSYTKDGRQVKQGKRKVNTAGIWRPGRIRNMVVNTTYKGLHHYGKRTNKKRDIITRTVPAIVSEELWEKAQQVLRDNQLEAVKNAKRQYLLRGLIKCGICGLTYNGTAYRGPGKQPKAYYVCNGKTTYKGPLQGKCTSKNLPAEWIEGIVWKACVDFINNPGDAIKELAASMEERKSQKAALTTELEMVKNAAKEKEIEKQNILDLYRKQIIGSADVEQQLQKIDREKAALDQRARDLEKQIKAEEGLAQQFNTVEELLADLKAKLDADPPFEVRREIVRALVKEIIVETKPSPSGGGPGNGPNNRRPLAIVTVRYSFFKDVTRTVRHAENNLDLLLTRRLQMPPWLLGHQWSGDGPGARLRRARVAKNLVIRDLAKEVKMTPEAISYLESGINTASLQTLRKLAKALEVPIAYLGCFEKLPEDTLGQRITKARLYHGLTKKEMAHAISVDPKTLRSWEQDRHKPLEKHLEKLKKYI